MKIFVAVPTMGTVCDAQPGFFRTLERRYAGQIEFVYPAVTVRRMFHDYARNCMVDEFLSSGADMLWFVDSDILPPDNVLDSIIENADKWEVAAAPYPVFMTPRGCDSPQVVFTVYKNVPGVGLTEAPVPHTGLGYVAGAGTGCLLIKRHVFDRLARPYFRFEYAEDGRITKGEDIAFCQKLHDAGIPVFIDFSVPCEHYKQVGLLSVNTYAVEYAYKSVAAYDRQIRQALKDQQRPSAIKSNLILPEGYR